MTLHCPCGFNTHNPEAFAEHMLVTQHTGDVEVEAESGNLAELTTMLGMIQRMGDPEAGELPEGMSIRRMSREDVLADDDLSEEEKAQILAAFDDDDPGAE